MTSVSHSGGTDTYEYDQNGNMTCRQESGVWFVQTYNAENHIASIRELAEGDCETPVKIAMQWDYSYDGDGVRTATLTTPYDENGNPQTASLTTYYFGGAYEVTDGTVKKYYALAGQTVAMRDGNGLQFFLTDHLGSVLAVTDASGTLISEQRYLPFGEVRTDVGTITQTDFGYTFQRGLPGTGLMDYRARFYAPYLNRFTQPDTIISNLSDPQSLNRFSYVLNQPLRYNDPTGHNEECGIGELGCNAGKYTSPPDQSGSLDRVIASFGVTTAGMNRNEKWRILRAVRDVGFAFSGILGISEVDAFRSVFSRGISFIKSDKTCIGATGYGTCWGQTKDNVITIFTDANGQESKLPQYYNNFLVHEIGHVFDNTKDLALSNGYSERIRLANEGWTAMPTGNAGFASSEFPSLWIQGDHSFGYFEETADMFLGWTYSRWGDDLRRANWMNMWMQSLSTNGFPPSFDRQYNCDEDTGNGC